MPKSSLKGLKARLRTEGRKIERRELTDRAAALGFASLDALFTAVTSKTPPKEEPAQVPAPPAAATSRINERDLRLARRYRQEKTARAEAERRLEESQAEADLRLSAVRAGIVDVDYAMTLLRRHITSIADDDAALAALDTEVYFSGLRKSAPYLFVKQTVPATTGPSGDDSPPPPAPKQETGTAPVDVRTMSKTEYAAWLMKQGLTDPTLGAPV
jgi:Fe-S cluster assembly iron-binding protein IscA